MSLSDYEKEKLERQARMEAELNRARRREISRPDYGEAPSAPEEQGEQSRPQADNEPWQDQVAEQRQPEEQKQGRFQSGINMAKSLARKRLRDEAVKKIIKRFFRKGVEEVAKQGVKIVGRAGVQAGGELAAGGLGAAVGAGGIVAGGAAAEGAAAGGTAVAAAGAPVLLIVLAVVLAIALIILILILLVLFIPVVMCNAFKDYGAGASWLANQLKFFDKDICLELAILNGQGQGGAKTNYQQCTADTLQTIASESRVPYPNPQNDPTLVALMTCIGNAVPEAKVSASLGVGSYTASGGFPVYTFDNTYINCNFTRGTYDPGTTNRQCSPACSHAPNSCHYGGSKYNPNPNWGSLAVDYSTKNGALAQRIVNAANSCGAKQPTGARCEDGNSAVVPCASASMTHVHITAANCDRN